MKLFRMLEGMQKSTRLTLLGCVCFLAVTALILLFLMFFPITPSEKDVLTISRVTADQKDEETYPAIEFNWDDVQHELSTWSAGVNGFSRSLDDFTTTKPEETTMTGTSAPAAETFVTSDMTDFSDDTSDMEYIPPFPQTMTETVKVDETEPPAEQTEPPPVVAEPPTIPPQEPEEE